MATPSHWPGGIPREIKRHATDVSRDEIEEQVKGWLLFVRESWLPRPSDLDADKEYELRQRRALVQQWASASQEFRDSYHNRAISEGNQFPSYPREALERVYAFMPCEPNHAICMAPVEDPLNKARWVKLAILFYRYDYEAGHCLPIMNPIPNMAVPNPATPNTHSVPDFLPWYYLESACFGDIYLTKMGSVLYEKNTRHFMIVDEEGLKTARLTLVEFALNGDIRHSTLIRPFNMFPLSLDLFVNGRVGVLEAKERSGGRAYQNTP
ncbi:hypothetical protein N7453_006311 [Penicillium expansum]|nr:hypothetical protein N7453_006311 [Penicillium expansum]